MEGVRRREEVEMEGVWRRRRAGGLGVMLERS